MTARSIPKARRATTMLAALALVCATTGEAMGDERPLPPPRPQEFAAPAEALPKPQSEAPNEGLPSACFAKLIASGASAEAEPAPPKSVEGCGIDAPVRLSSIMVGGNAVSLPDRPLVACEFALALADYVRLIVAPLGQAMLQAGRSRRIETGPGYTCQTQDRIVGAKISAHGHGIAVDFVAITFADKRRVLVERQTGADEASYVRAVRTAACGWFTTVLGPGGRRRSTPTTCISTSNSMARAGVIAFASSCNAPLTGRRWASDCILREAIAE